MKKAGWKRSRFAAALIAVFAFLMSVGAMACYGATYDYDDYDWDSGAEQNGYAAPFKVTDEDETSVGPGVAPGR